MSQSESFEPELRCGRCGGEIGDDGRCTACVTRVSHAAFDAVTAYAREVALHAVTKHRLQTLIDLLPQCERRSRGGHRCQSKAMQRDAYLGLSVCDACAASYPTNEAIFKDLGHAKTLRGLQ